ncbi:hypothetical protein T4B_2332 [Trichinella pseudospiralis]|uniref:Uncharacterized protein n=1 Tax=Trichinella pseudospiralis TaxID=6337 RepID=A0A0V1J1S2_TRIPS|nr:hypothetical protein T4C_9027 [Trichinella pseudospiralis]KRZ26518.1 hypothetical protein T4C_960 [Trichinella pseudospiralis]KRZ28919.1 hypothetical protein T4B_2332 [Trichinella pseudospiralis]
MSIYVHRYTDLNNAKEKLCRQVMSMMMMLMILKFLSSRQHFASCILIAQAIDGLVDDRGDW